MEPLSRDTSAEAERILIEGYRRMSPTEKLLRVRALSQAVQKLAAARIRRDHPELSAEEVRLRVAALWLDEETMKHAFDWSPGTRR